MRLLDESLSQTDIYGYGNRYIYEYFWSYLRDKHLRRSAESSSLSAFSIRPPYDARCASVTTRVDRHEVQKTALNSPNRLE